MYQEEQRARTALPGCQDPYPPIVGEHPRLKEALQLARTASEDGECNVLLTGETGTGKELFAYRIHSPRQGKNHYDGYLQRRLGPL